MSVKGNNQKRTSVFMCPERNPDDERKQKMRKGTCVRVSVLGLGQYL